jgi:hypothetical protein
MSMTRDALNTTIKFDHSPDGEIDIKYKDTNLSFLFYLGALHFTARQEFDEQETPIFATDKEGLKRLISMAEDSQESLYHYIEALGKALAILDKGAMGNSFSYLGWLLVGLADMGREIDNVKDLMALSLKQFD